MITEMKHYTQPSKVYLPLTDPFYKTATVVVKKGDHVIIGQPLANKYNEDDYLPVISTVSGIVSGFEERLDRFNKRVDHIVIENDFLGKTRHFEKLSLDTSPMDIRKRLKECAISQTMVDGLYTDIRFDKPIEHILVNAVYSSEPFISIDYDFVKQYSEELAEGIKLLQRASLAKTATLIVDLFMDEETLDALGKATVDKDIELVQVNTKRMNGWEYKTARNIIHGPLTSNLLESKMMYTSAYTCKMIYDAVMEGRPFHTRQITITGDAFNINALYDVRIGTPFTDLVADLGGYDSEEETYSCHIGNFLYGQSAYTDQFSITSSIDTIHVSAVYVEQEKACINCGECNDICPAGIIPKNIMDAMKQQQKNCFDRLHIHNCVECGLCSYACPSKINVMEWVRRAKRRLE